MFTQEIKINFSDDEGNKLGTLLITALSYGNYHIKNQNFKCINNVNDEFKNIPKYFKDYPAIPIVFNENNDMETFESILLLEETEYQLVFTPENCNVESISFPTIENHDKNSIFKVELIFN